MSFDDDELLPPRKAPRPIDENPDPADIHDSGEFVRCPFCKKYIFEDAEQCPYCKHFVTHESTHRHPAWFVITALVVLALMVMFYVLMFPAPAPRMDGMGP